MTSPEERAEALLKQWESEALCTQAFQWKAKPEIAAAIRAAEKAKRAACEKVAENTKSDGDERFGQDLMRKRITVAIRAMGKKS